jgi:hypothetical protein
VKESLLFSNEEWGYFLIDFRFLFAHSAGGRGNGKRPQVLQNRTRGKAAAGSIAFIGSHEPVAVR